MTKNDDILDGITAKTTKEELMSRLRSAATMLRKGDRAKQTKLAEIEERLRNMNQSSAIELRQVIVSAPDSDWDETIKFLEEFDDLLPTPLQRILIGGRVLLEHENVAGNA